MQLQGLGGHAKFTPQMQPYGVKLAFASHLRCREQQTPCLPLFGDQYVESTGDGTGLPFKAEVMTRCQKCRRRKFACLVK